MITLHSLCLTVRPALKDLKRFFEDFTQRSDHAFRMLPIFVLYVPKSYLFASATIGGVSFRVVLLPIPADSTAPAGVAFSSRQHRSRHSHRSVRTTSIPVATSPTPRVLVPVGLFYTTQPMSAFTTHTGEIIFPALDIVRITGMIIFSAS